MTSLLLALVLTAPPVSAAPTGENAAPADKAAQRGYHEMAKDMRDLLKREAVAKSFAEKSAALCEMCDLYTEISRDSRLAVSDTLKEYKTTIWSRLTRSKNELKAQVAREKKQTKGKKPAEDKAEQARLAQQGLANQLAIMSYSLGGPAKVFAEGANNQQAQGGSQPAARGGAAAANADELIDLIEHTISPTTWDTNGGPGSIKYYPGVMALVISAPGEVHRQLGDTLELLRDAGR